MKKPSVDLQISNCFTESLPLLRVVPGLLNMNSDPAMDQAPITQYTKVVLTWGLFCLAFVFCLLIWGSCCRTHVRRCPEGSSTWAFRSIFSSLRWFGAALRSLLHQEQVAAIPRGVTPNSLKEGKVWPMGRIRTLWPDVATPCMFPILICQRPAPSWRWHQYICPPSFQGWNPQSAPCMMMLRGENRISEVGIHPAGQKPIWCF